MSTDKEQATRLADHIRIDQDWCEEASALLRRWPDGEPVAWRWQSPTGGWAYGEAVNPHAIPGGFAVQPLYTAPPAERIAALEQARVALERIYFFQQDIGHPPLASVAEQMREMARSALRKIEEVGNEVALRTV